MTTEMHFEDTKVDLSRQKRKGGVGAVIQWVGYLPCTWSIGFDWGGIMEGGVERKGGEEREVGRGEGRGGKGSTHDGKFGEQVWNVEGKLEGNN